VAPGKKIAYLAIYEFTEKSGSDFEKAADQILASDAKGIILDLRGDPGGYLESAVEIASWFLPQNETVVIEDQGNGSKQIIHRSTGINKLGDYQTVVLINQGSASASEILAGALRDDKKFQLVGEKSFGKGSVQEFEQMQGGTSLKITVAKWLTPSGHSIMEEGLEPDVKVDLTADDINNGHDPQLDKALELFK
jgi:carboxyl-terminal processing protease